MITNMITKESNKKNNGLKIISWNVNGFRAVVNKGFYKFLKSKRPDFLCLQEIKQDQEPELPLDIIRDYNLHWNAASRKGYAGTAIFYKKSIKVLSVWNGLGIKRFDDEGRVINLELPNFYIVNVYYPNAQHGLLRLNFKIDFDRAIINHLQALKKKKPVIVCGDFNVAHKEIDLANPKQNVKNPGFTAKERLWMDKLLSNSFIDSFRVFHPDEAGHYSWWSYRFNARVRNIGWRVDYVLISKELKPKLRDAFILKNVFGSDHAPVGVQIS